jgi:hypothetical protein
MVSPVEMDGQTDDRSTRRMASRRGGDQIRRMRNERWARGGSCPMPAAVVAEALAVAETPATSSARTAATGVSVPRAGGEVPSVSVRRC